MAFSILRVRAGVRDTVCCTIQHSRRLNPTSLISLTRLCVFSFQLSKTINFLTVTTSFTPIISCYFGQLAYSKYKPEMPWNTR
jgi:hypothetical protein